MSVNPPRRIGLADLLSSLPSSRRSDPAFFARLEKHLDDVRKGKGYLSAQTGEEIFARHRDNASGLGGGTPNTLRLYDAYSTAFNYDQKARFVNGVNGTLNLSEEIQKAHSAPGVTIDKMA